VNLFDVHQKIPAFSSTDERFLTLAIAGEAGRLANMVKKRWMDKTEGRLSDLGEEIRDEIADIRIYLELIAACFDIGGDKLDRLVQQTFVVESHADDGNFIALALCNRVGRLGDVIETRWVVNETNGLLRGAAQTAIVNVRIYLEMIAKLFLIEGKKLDQRVEQKLAKILQKHSLIMDKDEKATDAIK